MGPRDPVEGAGREGGGSEAGRDTPPDAMTFLVLDRSRPEERVYSPHLWIHHGTYFIFYGPNFDNRDLYIRLLKLRLLPAQTRMVPSLRNIDVGKLSKIRDISKRDLFGRKAKIKNQDQN